MPLCKKSPLRAERPSEAWVQLGPQVSLKTFKFHQDYHCGNYHQWVGGNDDQIRGNFDIQQFCIAHLSLVEAHEPGKISINMRQVLSQIHPYFFIILHIDAE